jgi:hypothetical protein
MAAAIVRAYTIELMIYHDEIIGRLVYSIEEKPESSALYSLPELQNIISLWKLDELQGSFAIGTVLASTAECTITQKV